MILALLQQQPPSGEGFAMAVLLSAFIAAALMIYVFYPPRTLASVEVKTRLAYLYERKEVVYDNLRDLNFEYKAGKYPDNDYNEMRRSLEDEATTVLAEIDQLEGRTR